MIGWNNMIDYRYGLFNYYFDGVRNMCPRRTGKWRGEQNAGHKNKVIKSRRKKNKNAKSARKVNRK